MVSQCLTPFVLLLLTRQREGCLYCSLELEDMNNCFGRISHSTPVDGTKSEQLESLRPDEVKPMSPLV
jgi:hypothetical protein